ncbi:MAG: DUF4256 domain-containing protein [Spirochaetes bacterium]|nr:DUF4256 domain-containing protein [Spirochaetota bacterium]MBU1079534.1 DUF4256 domain-containing protein [Spirochaetota bacterium]
MASSSYDKLVETLEARFKKNPGRHPGIGWDAVRAKLAAVPERYKPLSAMEDSGGEPDVVGYDADAREYLFCDCSAETPAGRKSLCYDREALDSRKENKPAGTVMEAAASMGIEVLDELQYRRLQELGEFDRKTSSWIRTPDDVRKLGGALFCDRRYGRVFTYHNGAESYYSARGFRGMLRV